PLSFSTPKKEAVNLASPATEALTKRRHTYSTTDKMRASSSDATEMFTSLSDPFDFEPSHNNATSESSKNSLSKPSDSPTRLSVHRKLTNDIAALYSSDGMRNMNNPSIKTGNNPSLKGKELGSPSAAIYALPHSHLISPPVLPPTLAQKAQRPNPPISSSAFSPNRSIGTDLSPIIEDMYTFVDPTEVNEDSLIASTVDSSGSSYGQLLEEMVRYLNIGFYFHTCAAIMTIDYFNLSQYGAFGGMEWGNDESRQTEYSAQHSTQGYGDIQDPGWRGDHLEPVEQSVLIPELTLTVPTPELGSSAQFPSDAEPRPLLIDDIIDRPLRKKKTSTVATSKTEGSADLETTYADMNSGGDLDLGLGLNRRSSGVFRGSRQGDLTQERLTERRTTGNGKINTKTKRLSSFRWSILPPAMPVCIHEEGEHAASRLFGLPSTREASKLSKNEAQRSPRVVDKSERQYQVRRHSFGFNMKSFAKRRRYVEDDTIKEL
ncbi:hypothetical protein CVT25_011897, partial [Psilocybe cyanescens]